MVPVWARIALLFAAFGCLTVCGTLVVLEGGAGVEELRIEVPNPDTLLIGDLTRHPTYRQLLGNEWRLNRDLTVLKQKIQDLHRQVTAPSNSSDPDVASTEGIAEAYLPMRTATRIYNNLKKLRTAVHYLMAQQLRIRKLKNELFPTWANHADACPDHWLRIGYMNSEHRVHCRPPVDKMTPGNSACREMAKFPKHYDRCGWSIYCKAPWRKYNCFTFTHQDIVKHQHDKEKARIEALQQEWAQLKGQYNPGPADQTPLFPNGTARAHTRKATNTSSNGAKTKLGQKRIKKRKSAKLSDDGVTPVPIDLTLQHTVHSVEALQAIAEMGPPEDDERAKKKHSLDYRKALRMLRRMEARRERNQEQAVKFKVLRQMDHAVARLAVERERVPNKEDKLKIEQVEDLLLEAQKTTFNVQAVPLQKTVEGRKTLKKLLKQLEFLEYQTSEFPKALRKQIHRAVKVAWKAKKQVGKKVKYLKMKERDAKLMQELVTKLTEKEKTVKDVDTKRDIHKQIQLFKGEKEKVVAEFNSGGPAPEDVGKHKNVRQQLLEIEKAILRTELNNVQAPEALRALNEMKQKQALLEDQLLPNPLTENKRELVKLQQSVSQMKEDLSDPTVSFIQRRGIKRAIKQMTVLTQRLTEEIRTREEAKSLVAQIAQVELKRDQSVGGERETAETMRQALIKRLTAVEDKIDHYDGLKGRHRPRSTPRDKVIKHKRKKRSRALRKKKKNKKAKRKSVSKKGKRKSLKRRRRRSRKSKKRLSRRKKGKQSKSGHGKGHSGKKKKGKKKKGKKKKGKRRRRHKKKRKSKKKRGNKKKKKAKKKKQQVDGKKPAPKVSALPTKPGSPPSGAHNATTTTPQSGKPAAQNTTKPGVPMNSTKPAGTTAKPTTKPSGQNGTATATGKPPAPPGKSASAVGKPILAPSKTSEIPPSSKPSASRTPSTSSEPTKLSSNTTGESGGEESSGEHADEGSRSESPTGLTPADAARVGLPITLSKPTLPTLTPHPSNPLPTNKPSAAPSETSSEMTLEDSQHQAPTPTPQKPQPPVPAAFAGQTLPSVASAGSAAHVTTPAPPTQGPSPTTAAASPGQLVSGKAEVVSPPVLQQKPRFASWRDHVLQG